MARILLVEDNEENWDMLSRRLRRRGHEVLIAVDGEKGVTMATREHPDIILLDMNLPVVDGWTAARRLKGDPVTRHVPIVALTAHAMAGDRDKALEAGCDDYHAKPVNLAQLLTQMEGLLARER